MEARVVERFASLNLDVSRAPLPDALDSALQILESTLDADADALAHCQAHAGVAACWLERADAVQAEWHWQQASRWARLHSELEVELDVLCAMAATSFKVAQHHERLGDHGQARMALNRARDACFEGVQAVPSLRDTVRQAQQLNRLADVLGDCGDRDDEQALRASAQRLHRQSVN